MHRSYYKIVDGNGVTKEGYGVWPLPVDGKPVLMPGLNLPLVLLRNGYHLLDHLWIASYILLNFNGETYRPFYLYEVDYDPEGMDFTSKTIVVTRQACLHRKIPIRVKTIFAIVRDSVKDHYILTLVELLERKYSFKNGPIKDTKTDELLSLLLEYYYKGTKIWWFVNSVIIAANYPDTVPINSLVLLDRLSPDLVSRVISASLLYPSKGI
jgi:hypothetical protein